MPASPSTARALNDRHALGLLQQEGPLTAAQLKQLTGLSRPSVADLVERLTAAGLIEVTGEAGAHRRGPNAKVYGIVGGRAQLAALDVRTEGVAVVVCDLVGRVLAEASVPIGGDTGTGPAVEQAVTLLERAAKEGGADALHTVCVGAPGLIDPGSGELRDSTGLPTWHRRLVSAIQERFPQARVLVENEANLAALAERADGVAQDRDTFVLLWLAHGIGAAVLLDGHLRRGASGGTGEIGFLPVPGAPRLPSAYDCEGGFHTLVGSAAVLRLAEEFGVRGGSGAAGVVREAARVAGPATPGAEPPVRGAAGTVTPGAEPPVRGTAGTATPGEEAPVRPAAGAFLDALAERIALGVASVVAVLDPGCVVLGGEIGQAGGAELAGRVEERIRRMAPLPTEVRASGLGDEAVLRGALLTARGAAQDQLFDTAG